MQAFYSNKIKLQKIIGDVVKKYRLKQNKSISLISAEIGMTKSMWADLEKGKKDPQFSTLFRISEGLNIPITELISEIKDELGIDFTFLEL